MTLRRPLIFFAGTRPTVIRIRRDQKNVDGVCVCTLDDAGMSASRKSFSKIAELVAILKPEQDEDPTYVKAVAALVDRFRAVVEKINVKRPKNNLLLEKTRLRDRGNRLLLGP